MSSAISARMNVCFKKFLNPRFSNSKVGILGSSRHFQILWMDTGSRSLIKTPLTKVFVHQKDFSLHNLENAKVLWYASTWNHERFYSKIPSNKRLEEVQKNMKRKKQRMVASTKFIRQDFEKVREKVKEKMEDIVERENIWTIPNLLCVSRIALSPVLCTLVINGYHPMALGLFVFAGFTDLIDGLIARSFPSQASKIGSFLDPLADKVLVASLFLTLTYTGAIPGILTAMTVGRDVLIVAGASYIRYKSLPAPKTISRYFDATYATVQLSPTLISKFNTALQLGLISATLAAPVFAFQDHYLLETLWYVTGVSTFLSGLSYIYSKKTYKILKMKKRNS